jgi:transglutaminase-like putative cysteine protease
VIHDKRRFSVVLAALAVAFAPHLLRVPLFVGAFVCAAWGYALGMQYRGWAVPPRWLRVTLALGCLAAVFAFYGRSFGRDEGVALLSLMLGLKAVESKSVRDMLALLFLAYFVVVTNVLYSQGLAMSAYMILSVLAVTAALVHLHSARPGLLPDLRRGAVLLAQSLPLALLLFVFFPRLPGALWGVQDDRDEGVTGFSDSLEPGSVSTLSLSTEVAFRVDFAGPPPERDGLYWRGLVLDTFDGARWFRDLPFELADKGGEQPMGLVEYAVTVEPHGKEWLFALDLPVSAPRGTVLRSDRTLASLRMLRSRMRFELASAPVVPESGVPGPEWTALPDDGNPRARELALEWKRQGLGTRGLVEAALALFRGGNFAYSLQPGVMEGDIVDQFLFATRRGYCEHYASAMTFMLRTAGVPARVVVGYQGGEMNPMGEYLIVRQSDAHAWVEVWQEGRWLRVDPTSVVAPQRLAVGAEAIVSPQGQGSDMPAGARVLRRVGRFFQFGWDAANNAWNQWVLGFSHDRQRSLWQRLGFDPSTRAGAGKLAALLAFGLALVLGTVFWFMLRARREARDRVALLYARFCRRMERAGLPRGAAEGPVDYAGRISRERPDLAAEVGGIVDAYVALRYAARGDVDDFSRLVGEFTGRRF